MTQANKDFHAPLLAAVGLLTPDMTSSSMFILAHIVAEASPVFERRFVNWVDTYSPLEVVEAMTDAEREELAERIRTHHAKWF